MNIVQKVRDYFSRFKVPNIQSFSYDERLAAGALTRAELEAHREASLDMYKDHLKLLLEANVFVYAVTGALVSFVITHTEIPHIQTVLWLPIILGVTFATLFLIVSFGFSVLDMELQAISAALRLNTYQTINALPIGLWISALALLVMVGLLMIGYWHFPMPSPPHHCSSFVPI